MIEANPPKQVVVSLLDSKSSADRKLTEFRIAQHVWETELLHDIARYV